MNKIRDYIQLAKPRLVGLVLLTTLAGYYLGSLGSPDILKMLIALTGTCMVAAGALALNQYAEKESDAIMKRTCNRPLPDGRLDPKNALIFGSILSIAGLAINFIFVNPLTGYLALLSIGSYLLIYTPMKKVSSLCILVGAIPGALPAAGGWVAATGVFDYEALILFAILFFWQIPHSLAIAWLYRFDYEKAGIKLLPDITPSDNMTGHQVLLNTMALLPIGLMPAILGMTGYLHFFTALLLGIGFAYFAARFAFNRSISTARGLLYASYLYIPVQLGFMSFDQLVK